MSDARLVSGRPGGLELLIQVNAMRKQQEQADKDRALRLMGLEQEQKRMTLEHADRLAALKMRSSQFKTDMLIRTRELKETGKSNDIKLLEQLGVNYDRANNVLLGITDRLGTVRDLESTVNSSLSAGFLSPGGTLKDGTVVESRFMNPVIETLYREVSDKKGNQLSTREAIGENFTSNYMSAYRKARAEGKDEVTANSLASTYATRFAMAQIAAGMGANADPEVQRVSKAIINGVATPEEEQSFGGIFSPGGSGLRVNSRIRDNGSFNPVAFIADALPVNTTLGPNAEKLKELQDAKIELHNTYSNVAARRDRFEGMLNNYDAIRSGINISGLEAIPSSAPVAGEGQTGTGRTAVGVVVDPNDIGGAGGYGPPAPPSGDGGGLSGGGEKPAGGTSPDRGNTIDPNASSSYNAVGGNPISDFRSGKLASTGIGGVAPVNMWGDYTLSDDGSLGIKTKHTGDDGTVTESIQRIERPNTEMNVSGASMAFGPKFRMQKTNSANTGSSIKAEPTAYDKIVARLRMAKSDDEAYKRVMNKDLGIDIEVEPAGVGTPYPGGNGLKRGEMLQAEADKIGKPVDKSAEPPVAPIVQLFSPALGKLFHGELDKTDPYNSFNRGKAGDSLGLDVSKYAGNKITNMTIGDILQVQQKGKVFAIGKYQFTPNTLRENYKRAGLSLNDTLNEANQDKLAVALMVYKRPLVFEYIRAKNPSADLRRNALRAMALEWASIADPDTGKSAYDNDEAGNTASVDSTVVASVLDEIREAYHGKQAAVLSVLDKNNLF